jgi:ketosteroid isomerase-like protein
MRRLMIALGTVVVLAGSAQGQGSDATRTEIDSLLTAWHHAAATADEDTYFRLLADDAVFLGTDPGERWTKPEFEKAFMRYFVGRDEAWVFVATQRSITISADGDVAWFDELLDSKSYWTCRGSGVLTRRNGRWLLRQYNLSFTIPNGITGAVKAIVERSGEKHPRE